MLNSESDISSPDSLKSRDFTASKISDQSSTSILEAPYRPEEHPYLGRIITDTFKRANKQRTCSTAPLKIDKDIFEDDSQGQLKAETQMSDMPDR